MATRSADDKLVDSITTLRRHLKSCKRCHSAIKANAPDGLCQIGALMTLSAATRFDSVIRLRIQAHNTPGHVIFACPKLSAHGKAYELTAEPYQAVAIQDRLF